MGLDVTDRIGFVVPAYNAVRWVADALDSLRGQSSPEWVAVVVDDGSTDGTGDRVARWIDDRRRAPHRVMLVRPTHHGLAPAVNFGMAMLATHADPPALVACLAADDMLSANYVALMVSVLASVPAAPCAYPRVKEFGTRTCEWFPGPWRPGAVLERNPIPGCAVWRRAIWDRLQGFDERFTGGNEDWHFAAKAEAAGVIGHYTRPQSMPHAVYMHRARADSLTDTMTDAYKAWTLEQIRALFPAPTMPSPRVVAPTAGAIVRGPYEL